MGMCAAQQARSDILASNIYPHILACDAYCTHHSPASIFVYLYIYTLYLYLYICISANLFFVSANQKKLSLSTLLYWNDTGVRVNIVLTFIVPIILKSVTLAYWTSTMPSFDGPTIKLNNLKSVMKNLLTQEGPTRFGGETSLFYQCTQNALVLCGLFKAYSWAVPRNLKPIETSVFLIIAIVESITWK